jgi:DNA-binding CsgD family transcriptional regulator
VRIPAAPGRRRQRPARSGGGARRQRRALEVDTQRAAIRLWLEMDTSEGRRLARRVAVRARSLQDRAGGPEALDERQLRALIDALQIEHEAALQDDDIEAMLAAARQREAAARALGEEPWLAASLALGVALRTACRVEESHERFRRVWATASGRLLPSLTVDAGYHLAVSLQVEGRLAEAEEIALDTQALAARVGDVPRGRHRLSLVTNVITVLRGRWRDGIEQLELAGAADPSEHPRIAFAQARAVWLARVRGEAAATEVTAAIREARRWAHGSRCPRCAGELGLMAAESLARVGRWEEAGQALAASDPQGTWIESAGVIRRRTAALLRLREGDVQGALCELETAREESAELGLGLEELWTRLDLGLALVPIDRTSAAETLRAAGESAERNGVVTAEQLADRALRTLGVHTWRRGAAVDLGSLTERERDIVRLVAAGLSNPEIASSLFLSRKTIERHVSNVLAKLGARNRTELAARVAAGDASAHEGAPR